MLYLFIDKNQIKLLYVKKTLLGQYESPFYEKTHQVDLLKNNSEPSTDLLASAVKEALTTITQQPLKEKEITLILPQECFTFLRAEVPTDIAPSAVSSFIRDKARMKLKSEMENYVFDYLLQENNNQQQILFFAVERDLLQKYYEVMNLLGMQISGVIPESMAYFKLFEKTLRKDKKEFILYSIYNSSTLTGYFYDSYGPLEQDKWVSAVKDDKSAEEVLKLKGQEYEAQGQKVNRLIISGENSENIRQDTFTKNVGMWTNPLKRILPNFYHDYLKLLVVPNNQPFPILQFDVCIGAFIFSLENKNFSFFKKKLGSMVQPSRSSGTSVRLPMKEIGIFLLSFIASFIVLLLVTRVNFSGVKMAGIPKFGATATPTQVPPTSTPVPSPTPSIDRKTVKIKVLNGSGVKGKATDVKNVLKDKGYVDILTGNADNFDYKTTEIQVPADKAELGNMLKADLKDNTESPNVTKLDDKNAAADVILIFGADFK